jgi:hypothetical protein
MTRALADEDEFAELVQEMVTDEAPRLFAVVQELGDRVDGRVAAWGLAFEDHADLVRCGGGFMSVSTPDRACWLLSRQPDVTARLVWL